MPPAAHFVTVYEFSPFLVAGWPFFLAFIFVTIVMWRLLANASRPTKLRMLIVWAAGFLAFGFFAIPSVARHLETFSRVQQGLVSIVEGTITDTQCVGKDRQAFAVGQERFVPSAFGTEPGFESAQAFSNSVLDGMHVRVHFFDASWGTKIITKLENDMTTGVYPPGAKLFGPCSVNVPDKRALSSAGHTSL